MKRTKILLGAAALAMSLVALPSCGGSDAAKPNFEVPTGGYDGSEVTIKFYHTMSAVNLTPTLDEYIKLFNEIYPNIKVEYTSIGGYDDVRDQIKTEISIGEQPNIAYCYPDHVALYNKAKAVVTLDSLIESTESDGANGQLGLTEAQKNDFIQGYYDEGKQFGDGLMYTLPFSKSTEVLYYNKDAFTAAGITSVPNHWFSTGDTDTTSMEYACKKLKEYDPKCIPLGYDSESNWFITMCEQMKIPYTSATGDHFLFNNDQAKDFVRKFQDWYNKGYVTTQKIYGAYTSALFTEVGTAADTIKSYMSIGSSAGATHQRPSKKDNKYPFDIGIAEIPQADANNKKVISQGPSLCIFKSDNPQEVIASWLFTKYLTTSVEFQAEFSLASGYVPVLKSVVENAKFKAELDKRDGGDHIASLSAYVCMQQVDNYYTSPAFIGSSAARDQVGAIMAAMLADTKNEKNIDTVFADAVSECEYQVA